MINEKVGGLKIDGIGNPILIDKGLIDENVFIWVKEIQI
jgi:hypothetical protein